MLRPDVDSVQRCVVDRHPVSIVVLAGRPNVRCGPFLKGPLNAIVLMPQPCADFTPANGNCWWARSVFAR